MQKKSQIWRNNKKKVSMFFFCYFVVWPGGVNLNFFPLIYPKAGRACCKGLFEGNRTRTAFPRRLLTAVYEDRLGESVLFVGTQFSNLYTAVDRVGPRPTDGK